MTNRFWYYMMRIGFRPIFFCFFCVVLFSSCTKDKQKSEVAKIVQEWQGKEVHFPSDLVFTKYGEDTVEYQFSNATHKILMYVDSIGCTSCKLQLHKWKEFASELDSVTNGNVPILFFFQQKDFKELSFLLKRDGIDFPVCVDVDNKLNKLNRFPADQEFQTFLLDGENRVVLIGNPVLSPRIKELYLTEVSQNRYQSDESPMQKTKIQTDRVAFDLGTIRKGDAKEVRVSIKNVGDSPFVFFDIQASCGCTHIDYEKKPILADSTTTIGITYNADNVGFFNKTVAIYGNMDKSPMMIQIRGKVE